MAMRANDDDDDDDDDDDIGLALVCNSVEVAYTTDWLYVAQTFDGRPRPKTKGGHCRRRILRKDVHGAAIYAQWVSGQLHPNCVWSHCNVCEGMTTIKVASLPYLTLFHTGSGALRVPAFTPDALPYALHWTAAPCGAVSGVNEPWAYHATSRKQCSTKCGKQLKKRSKSCFYRFWKNVKNAQCHRSTRASSLARYKLPTTLAYDSGS